MMVNNWTKKALGGILVAWTFSGPVLAQNLGSGPAEDEPEETKPVALHDVELEFSEDQRALLKELRAWLHQRKLERARSAVYRSGDMDDAGRLDSDAVYRYVRPPRLLHDARNWQARPQPRLRVGKIPDERIRDTYGVGGLKPEESRRQTLGLGSGAEHQAPVLRSSTPAETKAKSRVRLVWTTDLARHKPDSR
ncbi:conserved exported protein of unknown function [Methylocaldum szegediense]|uniref:Uncharacterized protein n=1 Tax=Methylocaldum szegediense TaxID=73780 RepID=A0ABN8X7H4_9GAMM|nr:conserved exported protein of unknown function [Methylocaldum szegediense]